MKKVLFIILICLSGNFYGQIISVNSSDDAESTFSLEKLIEDVLISSSCTTVDNFSSQVYGNPDDRENKSYGFFKKPIGSSFPFNEGIILTNGTAYLAGNITNGDIINEETSNNLQGDSDLEEALDIFDTQDATFVKFNFTPLVNTISFRFIMASEEYDDLNGFECEYADGFAFLLREVGTTEYINLAVLPDGTPVNVTNINNSMYCNANPDYFAGYNLTDTNYGGRTKVLTATAPVEPNKVYEMKLVVADQGDDLFDPAIFLEAGSFNIGSDLGLDRTIASGNPGCSGEPIELDATVAIADATYKWFKDGAEVVGETNPTYNVTENGMYMVEIDAPGCSSSDKILIEFSTSPVISDTPNDMFLCESDDDLKETFDFSDNRALVLGDQAAANFRISFHASQTNAETNTDPIETPTAYTNTNQNETIWIRIADKTQTCFKVTSFNIAVYKEAIANQPEKNYELCDDEASGSDTDGISTFDLSTQIDEILGDQSSTDYDVKFYYSQPDADAAVSSAEITSPFQNTSSTQVIYARVENKNNTGCYDTTSFNIVLNALPTVNSTVTLTQCDDDTDRISKFNLTEANILISDNSENETFTYYLSEANAEGGLVEDQITNYINYPNPTASGSAVYSRIETAKGCYRTAKIDLIVVATQIPSTFNLTYEVCDDKLIDDDNTKGIATFDFSDADQQIKDILSSEGEDITITYYTNEADALSETNKIPDISNHRNVTSANTQQIYVRVDSDIVNACLGLGNHITLIVNPLPTVNEISDYELCSDTDFAVFDLTTRDVDVIGTQTTPILVSYHLTEQDAINNIPIPNSTSYTNISNPQTIVVRAQFDENENGVADADECYSTNMTFNLVVNHNPTIFEPDTIRICNDIVTTDYDLTVRENQITGGNTSIILSYFETPMDLDNNTPIANPKVYTNTLLDRDIMVLATDSNTDCISTSTLSLKTIIYENLNKSPSAIEECEVDNNGYDFFDLTRRETEILNGLNTSDFNFTYYESEVDAIAGNTNRIPNSANFENTTPVTQTIYVRVLLNSNECFIVVPINLVVNPVPEIDIEEKYVICLTSKNEIISPENTPLLTVPPINTKLNTTEYTFQWYKGTETEVNADPAGTSITGATEAQYTPVEVGNYTVFATNISSGCRIPASTLVVGSYPPESISVELLSVSFADNNIIEVTVIGNGEYEYKLDSGLWQSSNRFERIPGGEHTVYVRDLLNCNEISEMQIVIDYPRYFTPNGDGVNDTWNIKAIASQPNSEILIFDRYGKLLLQIKPNEEGWDGTVNGEKFPTGDYWFIVKYGEPINDAKKEFRAHFTLKR